MSDIEARARAYADSGLRRLHDNKFTRSDLEMAYYSGARAEVELERRRILSELLKRVYDDWGISISKEELRKIIEGEA